MGRPRTAGRESVGHLERGLQMNRRQQHEDPRGPQVLRRRWEQPEPAPMRAGGRRVLTRLRQQGRANWPRSHTEGKERMTGRSGKGRRGSTWAIATQGRRANVCQVHWVVGWNLCFMIQFHASLQRLESCSGCRCEGTDTARPGVPQAQPPEEGGPWTQSQHADSP